ncbi:hypothetical protein KC336_g22388 [Hortaea werneckii]|nr:hypothetical protein KC336_g22388 [Hortaea werneckii]
MAHFLVEVEFSQTKGLIRDVCQAVLERKDRIVEARQEKGGWEGWLQVELAHYLRRRKGMEYAIEREQPIFASRQLIDLWASPLPSRNDLPWMGVELKVESEFQTGSGKTLLPRFKDDILKCNAGPKVQFKGRGGTWLCAVAITSLEGDLAGYKQVAIDTNMLISYCRLVVDRDYPMKDIFVLWWGKYFKA